MDQHITYFKKIPLLIENLDVGQMKGELVDDIGSLKNFVCTNYQEIEQQLRSKVIFHVKPLCVFLTEIKGGVGVHTDGAGTNLSFYIETDGSMTRFWVPDYTKTIKFELGDAKNYDIHTWNMEDLSLADSFVAQNGDCYLMNVEHPHSVDFPATDNPRYLLKWLWKEDFDTVKSSIEIL